MRVSVQVNGLQSLLKAIAAQSPRGKKTAAVEVGYDAAKAPYGIWVHELPMNHPNGGQWKFLTSAIQPSEAEMAQAIYDILRQGGSMADAVREAGNVLLVNSLPLVPVDTGNLRDSAYVRPVGTP